ncbi:MAG: L,D-transpeptidase [Rhizobiales bacterium]|nr:L,D-transpeptidase [Hyphomicrobiales bacterium]NRB14585.1 L,D-transpeptidase [Hyphomicrobiales bacterium]
MSIIFKLIFSLILALTMALGVVPQVLAAGNSINVHQVLLQLAHSTPKVKIQKVAAKPIVYNPTKTWVNIDAKYAIGTLIIKTSERKLYYVISKGRALRYGIAVGKSAGRQWKGKSFISLKRPNPTWSPTAKTRLANPKLAKSYRPGPRNPLGVRALNLANTPLLRIHGTNNPSSIGKAVSLGCYRMLNADVIDLYDRVSVGTKVLIQS